MTPSRGRARFGVLVPFTNTNLEPDMALLRPEGVSLHVARLGGYDAQEIPDVDQMHGLGAADLDAPLRLLAGVRPDVVVYGCTSATLTHGPAFDLDLADRIRKMSGAPSLTAASALVDALRHLRVRRIGFASPYTAAINDRAVTFLAASGIDTVARGEVSATLDNFGQGALEPSDVMALAHEADAPEAEAIVLSCTDMRSVETIAALEAALGKPVISSNQAMAFRAMQLTGIDTALRGYGTLLERPRL
ncbi:MAG: Asp/Glu racemase [Pseudomonadota bacterium]